MKKIVFFSMILAVLTAGCKKDDSKSTALNYNDTDPIRMVFTSTHTIDVQSDYDITYEILGTDSITVLRFERPGVLKALNVGTDSVRISNGYETKTVGVDVDLFTEPTFEFGCSPARIKSLYGNPSQAPASADTLCYIYIGGPSTNYMYSPTCYHMDFFFIDSQYVISQVYIRSNNIEVPFNNYFNKNFDYLNTIQYYNSYLNDSVPADIYRKKADESVLCIKYGEANQYHDYCLIYLEDDDEAIKKSSLIP